jgi:hypothetical protein
VDTAIPTLTEPVFRVKFHGGALSQHTQDFPREQPQITIFGWTYEATGRRDGDHWLFVPVPRNRPVQRFLLFVMSQTGNDPRLADKQQPVRVIKHGRNELCYCGSGRKHKRCHGGNRV